MERTRSVNIHDHVTPRADLGKDVSGVDGLSALEQAVRAHGHAFRLVDSGEHTDIVDVVRVELGGFEEGIGGLSVPLLVL